MNREEAIKILRDVHDDSLFSVRNALETLIPELKESEDEKIIDAIKHGLKCLGWEHVDGIKIADMIAWLEKQGEQKPDWSEEDKKMFVNVIDSITIADCCCDDMYVDAKKAYKEELDWLKSLKDRIGI